MARRAFEQAWYAEALRGAINVSEDEKLEAQAALRLLDLEKISYDQVAVYVNQIKVRQDKVFIIYDSLINAKLSLVEGGEVARGITGQVVLNEGSDDSTGEDVFLPSHVEDEKTKELFRDASVAFYEDREEAADFLMELRDHLEFQKLEAASMSGLEGVGDFVRSNWHFVLLGSMLFGMGGYVTYARFSRQLLKRRIEKMKIKRDALLGLVKKTQQERFGDNKISELVYNIRMKKYNESLAQIKIKLPVFESKLQGEVEKKV